MGHSKLTQRDQRHSKSKSIFSSKNIFGTEGYLAPEILKRTFINADEDDDTYFAIDVWYEICMILFTFILNLI